jgi:predicted dithiol-disulfide oxidoreductase (DUF899 family)
MSTHRHVTAEEWHAAREQLLVQEKEHTRRGDELARQRQALPWLAVEKQYTFDTETGPRTLEELFDGRSQLAVYHFMFGPDYDAGCPVCSSIADGFNGVVPLLAARDVTMIAISRAPLEKLLAYRRRMGWSFNWASSYQSDYSQDFEHTRSRDVTSAWAADASALVASFASDCGTDPAGYMAERPSLSVYARADGALYLSYWTTARGLEHLMSYYPILDRVPNGRAGDPPDPSWVRRHDELAAA